MDKLAVILETFSFFLVTFDLYSQNKGYDKKKITIPLALIAIISTLPFLICTFYVILGNIFHFDLRAGNFYVDMSIKSIFEVTLPIVFAAILVTRLSSIYQEKHKRTFLIIGTICFVLSKSLSLFQ